MVAIDRILELVSESELTAKDFANKAGLAGGSITDWKTGRSKPSVESLQRIAKYANVSLEWLTGLSYFRNASHHSFLISKTMAFISTLNKEDCHIIEDDINRLLKKDFIKSIDEPIIERWLLECSEFLRKYNKTKDYEIYYKNIINKREFINDKLNQKNKFRYYDTFPEIISLKTLLFDYSEHRDAYKIIYGNLQFSTVSFLEYNSLTCTDETIKNKVSSQLRYLKGYSENLKKQLSEALHMCPLYGKIAAGQPNWAEECIEGFLPIEPNLMNIVDPKECFFLRVNGESMNQIVKNGAFALIRKTDFVENGEIAVILVNGYDATLKKFSKQGELVILEPMSNDSSFTVQVYNKDTDIKVIGKYIGKMEMK